MLPGDLRFVSGFLLETVISREHSVDLDVTFDHVVHVGRSVMRNMTGVITVVSAQDLLSCALSSQTVQRR